MNQQEWDAYFMGAILGVCQMWVIVMLWLAIR